MYQDIVTSASEKVFAEFDSFLVRLKPDEASYGRESVTAQIISLLENERPES